MAGDENTPKKPGPIQLRDPAPYRGQGSYTEPTRPSRDVQHIIAGSTASKVNVIKLESGSTPQPFLQPSLLQASKPKQKKT